MPRPIAVLLPLPCALLLVSALALAADPAPPPPAVPCSAPEYHQFDFWVGDWEVTTPAGKPAGTNRVTRPLGQCVLQEHWKGAGGMSGESYSIYDRVGGHWHQTWVDDRGTLLTLDGGLVGRDMVLTGPARLLAGKPTLDRITWSPRSVDEVHQVWEQSTDGGGTWTVAFHGVYRPRR